MDQGLVSLAVQLMKTLPDLWAVVMKIIITILTTNQTLSGNGLDMHVKNKASFMTGNRTLLSGELGLYPHFLSRDSG